MPAVRAPDPPNERERLAALRAYAILDSEPEEDFDALTQLASFICGMPISTITLVDEDRQWFKSSVGLEDQEGPRDWSFCAYAVTTGETFVVEDALEDDRFRDNPYVTGDPKIRFYAGAPLTTSDGLTLGTLCVIDREPRTLTVDQRRALEALARQVRAQLELRRRNLELQALDRLKDEFVAGVSHELRTPLTSIQGYVETLLDGDPGPLTADQERFLRIVDRNAHRLLRLIGDLLFIAQVNAGKLELDREQIDVADIVESTVERVRPAADAKDVEIDVAIEPITIDADVNRVAQLVDNLASNAVKFTPSGGRVSISVAQEEGHAVVRVSDTGIGIPAAELAALFTRFQRASNASSIQGTGLGLAISKTIAEAHGGRIEVVSDEGRGSTFTARLPL